MSNPFEQYPKNSILTLHANISFVFKNKNLREKKKTNCKRNYLQKTKNKPFFFHIDLKKENNLRFQYLATKSKSQKKEGDKKNYCKIVSGPGNMEV